MPHRPITDSIYWPSGFGVAVSTALGAVTDLAHKMYKTRHGMFAIQEDGKTRILVNLSNLDHAELNPFACSISLYYSNRVEPRVLKFDSPEIAQRIMDGISHTFEAMN
jgi:hypothetical protein